MPWSGLGNHAGPATTVARQGLFEVPGLGSYNNHMAKAPTVGSRELKTRLGRYLRQVRAGQTLIVTDRGEPIAELRPLPAAAKETDAEAWARLVRSGLVAPFEDRPLKPFKRIRIRGKPLSQTIIEDREDRI